MRIVFIGAVEFSRRALRRLLDNGAEVVGVCTLRESSFNSDFADLSALCESRGVPWRHTPDINAPATVAWIKQLRPDVVFCFGWSRLVGTDLLRAAPLGVVGYHPAALPANRGRHPLIWALALGLKTTASTFFFMDEGADSGDVLSQRPIAIDDDDDAGTLYAKMTDVALAQLDEFVPQLASGNYPRRAQSHEGANVWRKRGRQDGQIDWRMSAVAIHNLVRALTKPYCGAHFTAAGADFKVWKCAVVDDVPDNIEPGKVLAVDGIGPLIKCGAGAIRLLQSEPAFHPKAGDYL